MELRDGQRRMKNRNTLWHGLAAMPHTLWHVLLTVPLRTGMRRAPCLLFCACVLLPLAASPARTETVTVRRLSGPSEEGELGGLSATQITLRVKAGDTRIPVEDTLDVTVPGN